MKRLAIFACGVRFAQVLFPRPVNPAARPSV
jgi:hypothetical protein